MSEYGFLLEELLNVIPRGYYETCSIFEPKNNSTTFIRNAKMGDILKTITKKIFVLAPLGMRINESIISPNVIIHQVDNPELVFTIFHNYVYKDRITALSSSSEIGNKCKIHETALIGIDGLKYVNGLYGDKIFFTHTGHAIIHDNVDIGAYSIVHRGTLSSTIIMDNVKIGCYCNVGHNSIIGENTVLAGSVVLSGSVTIGRDCWLSAGVMVRNGISICDDVIIGMGSFVVKDITKSGMYFGTPTTYIKPYEMGWNF